MKVLNVLAVLVMVCILGSGCATNPYGIDKTTQGTILGTAIGAGLGSAAGNNFGHGAGDRDKAALIGGIVGGLVGNQIGRPMDRQDQQQVQLNQLQIQQSMVTIWVTNTNGSRTPVTLRQVDGGMYMGPRGEYYTGLPTADQLKPAYGF